MAGKVGGTGPAKRGRAEVNADPNVIPFIDVMLVLLIIFMSHPSGPRGRPGFRSRKTAAATIST